MRFHYKVRILLKDRTSNIGIYTKNISSTEKKIFFKKPVMIEKDNIPYICKKRKNGMGNFQGI